MIKIQIKSLLKAWSFFFNDTILAYTATVIVLIEIHKLPTSVQSKAKHSISYIKGSTYFAYAVYFNRECIDFTC